MPASSLSRRIIYLVASFAPAWALVAVCTGGVGWVIGPLRISSRDPLRPLLLGAIAAIYFAWRYTRDERAADGRWLEDRLAPVLPWIPPLIVVLGFSLGVYYGSFAAAGSDSYGYLSQARLWLAGTLRVPQPLVEQLSWPNREWVFAPLGYRPYSADGTIVPTYPAGFPMVMAVFLGVFGEKGPFFVVPLFAAVTVWVTYLLGKEATGSKTSAVLAASLLLASPVFLTHLMVPMSDVPAAAGWALVALMALKPGGVSRPLLAGMTAGLTLLIRPNLVLLALMPAFAWHCRREPLLRYTLGLAPPLLALAALNTFLNGSPLTFGQGTLSESYAFSAAPGNIRQYTSWLVQTQTPLVALALLPLFVEQALSAGSREISPRGCLSAMVGLTFLSYMFYHQFDHWYYLRFLLPAYPALFVLMAAAVRYLCLKLPVEARVPVALCVCAAVIPYGVRFGSDAGIFRQAAYEQRHVRAAQNVAALTPQNAVVLAVQHSGSVRYYANRITLRYDWLGNDRLDAAIHDLTAAGYQPYVLLDEWEESEFRARFGPHSRIGKLNWAPIARVPSSPEVHLYALVE